MSIRYYLHGPWIRRIDDDGNLVDFSAEIATPYLDEYHAWIDAGNIALPLPDPSAPFMAGTARTQRQEARKQAQAAKLAKRGDDLGAVKLLVGL